MTIRYVEGDATCPVGGGQKILVHVCNDVGKWGNGFVLAVTRRWKEPERIYRTAFQSAHPPVLGDVQFVRVSDAMTVANVIGQRGVATRTATTPPVRYDAIRRGLLQVAARAKSDSATVHMPRIGCGLAGGDWLEVERIIDETLGDQHVDVTVYDLPGANAVQHRAN